MNQPGDASVAVAQPQRSEHTGGRAWPPAREANYALAIFTIALMFNFLDRGILTLLVEPIKRDLELSDTQISLIMGFAFVVFYAFIGLPVARLIDLYSRRLILGVGIAMWSGCTALCGLAGNFGQLFAARIGIGVGESANGPATYSLLADYFPPEKLPRAISILNMGFMFGTGLALVIGGTVFGAISAMPPIELPVLGEMRPWQLSFFAVGIPGLLVALLLATIREPQRRGRISGDSMETGGSLSYRELGRFLYANRTAYGPMMVGMGFSTILFIGLASWLPTFFIREHQWSIAQFGLVYGLITLFVSPVGLFLGGYFAGVLARRGHDDANMRMTVIASVVSLPLYVLFPLVSSAELALVLLAVSSFIRFMGTAPQNAALQIITPAEIRGQVTAIYLFFFNVVGVGLGPTLIAVLTDFVFADEAKLGLALALAIIVLEPLVILIFWLGLKPYGRCVARARSWS